MLIKSNKSKMLSVGHHYEAKSIHKTITNENATLTGAL